jgi:PAS domain-containing protein
VKSLARWSDFRLRTKGLIVIAFPVCATIAIVGASYVMGRSAAEAEQWVNHTLQVSEQIQRLRSSQIEGSAHVRAFFITGEEEFAEHARKAAASFDVTRQKLVFLTVDNPVQRGLLARILLLEESGSDRITQSIIHFKSGALLRDQRGPAMTANESARLKMENLLEAMDDEEKRLLIVRSRRVEVLRTKLSAITAFCVVFGFAGAAVMFVLFAAGITNRIGRLQHNVALLVTGGDLDESLEGRDEIGALSEGLTKAAEILRRRTTALEDASHGIAEVDAAGRYVRFNRAYSQMTGLSELSSAPSLAATVDPEDRHQVEEAVVEMNETGRTEIEARVVHPTAGWPIWA